MSKSASFCVGTGENAEWIGSLTADGSIDGFSSIFDCTTEADYRDCVSEALAAAGFAAVYQQPVDDQGGVPPADYAYAFYDGKVWISVQGRTFVPVADYLMFTTEQNEAYLREPCG